MNALVVALVATLAAPPALERAEAAWAEKRYDDAAAAYQEVYAATGDIAFLFARARAQQLAGDCAAAIETYEVFIATGPLPEAVTAAEAAIDECRAQLPEPEPEPEPEPTVGPGVPPPTLTDDSVVRGDALPPPRPWHRDPAGGALVGVGAAVAVTGAILAIVARTSQNSAERADDVIEYGDKNDRAFVMSRVSIPLLAVGGALIVGGIVRYVVVARKNRRRTSVISWLSR